MAHRFLAALGCWEAAAAAVSAREVILAELLTVQQAVDEEPAAALRTYRPEAVQAQCVSLVRLTAYIERLGADLKEEWACGLTYQGEPYPGQGGLGVDQLVLFVEGIKEAAMMHVH